jgi:hypothetical protein
MLESRLDIRSAVDFVIWCRADEANERVVQPAYPSGRLLKSPLYLAIDTDASKGQAI